MPIDSAYASHCDIIVTLDVHVSRTVLEILRHKARKWLVFPTPPLFGASLRGNPLAFLDETYHAKGRGRGLLMVKIT